MATNQPNKKHFLEKIIDAGSLAMARSIAEQARDNIFMYRVGISQSVGDVKLAVAINKYIEIMCCLFTLIVSGVNPIAGSNDEIKNIIKKISAENIDPLKLSVEVMNLLKKSDSLSVEYKPNIDDNPVYPRIGKNALSYENVLPHTENFIKTLGEIQSIIDPSQTPSPNNKKQIKWEVDDHFISKLDKYPGYPTILKITFHIYGSDLTVPIAVKANPQGIGTEEMEMFIESIISGRSYKFIRFFKWKSGEISTQEYLLGTDIADRDRKLYQSLGRNPIYIEFMKRKAKSRFMGSMKALSSNNENTIGPTGSLIVTTDDLVNATKLDIRRFTKNDEFIQRIMRETFILCFGIVDIYMEMISFYFMGYKEPFRVNFNELGVGKNVSSDKQLEQAILELSRKVS
jgi:hypothetical protein